MKKLMLMLTLSLFLACPASMAKADDFDDAYKAIQNGDYATAFRLFKPLAEQGDADAQYNLGVMYANGEGVIEDDEEAVRWYRKAAEQGIAEAQYNLGVRYANGEGVLQNYKEAVKWYRKAAEQGVAGAQNNLGVMYANGEGVLQDNKKAHMWWNLARYNDNDLADDSNDLADDNIEIITRHMTPAAIDKAQDMAKRCLESGYQDC